MFSLVRLSHSGPAALRTAVSVRLHGLVHDSQLNEETHDTQTNNAKPNIF